MKDIFEIDYIENIKINHTSRDEDKTPICHIEDFQSSNSNYPTRENSQKIKISKRKKTVRFNPIVTIVNIEAFKNETSKSNHKEFKFDENEKRCMNKCIIY